MTRASRPAAPAIKTGRDRFRDIAGSITANLCFAGVAVLCFWMSWTASAPFLSGLRHRQETISLMPRDLIALPLGVSFVFFCLLTFPPLAVRMAARHATARRSGWSLASLLLLGAFVSLMAVAVTVPIVHAMADAAADNRGYRSCGAPPVWTAHPPLKWALPGARCY